LLVVVLPYAAGYAARKLKLLNDRHAKIGIMISVLCFSTSVGFFAIWGIGIDPTLKFLPVAGFVITLLMIILCTGLSFLLKLDNRKKGSFIFSGALSNMGFTMGGIICFYFYGKEGYGRSVIYLFFFYLILYFICFPLARSLSGSGKMSVPKHVKEFFRDIRTVPIYTAGAAILLTVAGVESPAWSGDLLKILVPIAAVLGMACVGVTMRFTRIKNYLGLYPLVFFLKFAVTPIVALVVIHLFGFTGLSRDVVFLLSFMPSAVFSIYLSSFFDLDIDLANSMFVVTTIGFCVAVLPLLVIFL